MTAEGRHDDASLQEFEQAIAARDAARYELTLFITGASIQSARAVAAIRALCDVYLPGRYQLQIVDVHRDPELVRSRGVVASPTLIKDRPLPRRVLVGDMSDTTRLLGALGIDSMGISSSGGVDVV